MIDLKYARRNELLKFLSETDYKVIKEAETSYIMPQELKAERQAARDEINELELQIKEIEDVLQVEEPFEPDFTGE